MALDSLPTDDTLAPATKKRSSRGAESEKRFIDAANDVFWQHGFAASNIAQIVEASGLSVGSFYHFFADKSVLLQHALDRVMDDFLRTQGRLDLSQTANGDLRTMLFNLTLAGRRLVSRHHGIYRAISEIAQNDVARYEKVRVIGPTMSAAVNAVIDDYVDEIGFKPKPQTIEHAVQLISMNVLQSEMGLAQMYPKDLRKFADVVARGAYGVIVFSPEGSPNAKDSA